MVDYIYKRLTKSYSDRRWLVIVYDYINKLADDGKTSVLMKDKFEYKYFEEKKNWVDARSTCQEWGGDLASMRDDEEYKEIQKHLTQDDENYWLGANDRIQEGIWVWSDGSSSSYISDLWMRG